MISSRLKYRIQIQRPVVVRSDSGEPVTNWENTGQVMADIYSVTGREFFEANQVNSEVTIKIVIRFKDGLTTDMRVIHGSNIYNVVAVLNQDNRRRPTTLMCKRYGKTVDGNIWQSTYWSDHYWPAGYWS